MARSSNSLLDSLREQWLLAAMMLAVVGLAGVNWILSPEQAARWLRAMLSLPLLCLGLTLWTHWVQRSRPPTDADDARARQRYFHAVLALVIVAASIREIALFGLEIWVRVGDHRGDLDVERRILGLAASAVFVVVGNALPKILTPLSMLPVAAAQRVTRARRFVGAILVLLGLVLTAAFLAMPLALAKSLERWATVAGLLCIVGAVVWMNVAPVRSAR